MAQLPLFKLSTATLMQWITRWKALLDPVLASPLIGGSFLQNVKLISGATAINHMLGATPQGWFIVDTNAAITVFRSAPFDPRTLTLTSSGAATVSLYVF